MAALRRRGTGGRRGQGRARLHRPRLPRAGHRPAGPQPRRLDVRRRRRSAPLAAGPATAPTCWSSRGSWASSTARPTATPCGRPPTSPALLDAPGACWSSTRRRMSHVGGGAGARLRHASTPRVRLGGRGPEPGRQSDGHEAMLREALAPRRHPGARRARAATTRSRWRDRHLGLVPVVEQPAAVGSVARPPGRRCRRVAATSTPSSRLAAAGPAGRGRRPARCPRPSGRARVAVAGGPGVQLHLPGQPRGAGRRPAPSSCRSTRSPTPRLPDGVDGAVRRRRLPRGVRRGAGRQPPAPRRRAPAGSADGLVVWAECGGLLWLCRSLDGHAWPACSPPTGDMTDRLTLGYRRRRTTVDIAARARPGTELRGHEFHYSTLDPPGDALELAGRFGARAGASPRAAAGHYLHVHLAAPARLAEAFVAAAAAAPDASPSASDAVPYVYPTSRAEDLGLPARRPEGDAPRLAARSGRSEAELIRRAIERLVPRRRRRGGPAARPGRTPRLRAGTAAGRRRRRPRRPRALTARARATCCAEADRVFAAHDRPRRRRPGRGRSCARPRPTCGVERLVFVMERRRRRPATASSTPRPARSSPPRRGRARRLRHPRRPQRLLHVLRRWPSWWRAGARPCRSRPCPGSWRSRSWPPAPARSWSTAASAWRWSAVLDDPEPARRRARPTRAGRRRLQGRPAPAGDRRAAGRRAAGSTARWSASCSACPASGSGPVDDVADRPGQLPRHRRRAAAAPAGPDGARDLLRRRRARARPTSSPCGARDRLAAADVVVWAVVARARGPARPLPARRRDPRLQGHDARGRAPRSTPRTPTPRIVRLHSGDPAVYGAIGEQIDWCVAHERDFEIVPGVSLAGRGRRRRGPRS